MMRGLKPGDILLCLHVAFQAVTRPFRERSAYNRWQAQWKDKVSAAVQSHGRSNAVRDAQRQAMNRLLAGKRRIGA